MPAAPIAVVWTLYLAFTLPSRFQASIPLLFLAACYERPILDFGLGIYGTIKLFDLVALATVASCWRVPRHQKKQHVYDRLFFLGAFVVLIAVLSSLIVFVSFRGTRFELARLSLFYAAKLVECGLVLHAVRSVTLQRADLIRSLHLLVVGLSAVAIIGILQGMGLLSHEYYTSLAGGTAYTSSRWAISVLGPNHTHLGTYSALGIFLCIMLLQIRFRIIVLAAAALCLGSLYYSHSATGIAMLGFLVGMSLLFGDFSNKFLLAAVTIAIFIAAALYFTGQLGDEGDSAERNIERLSLGGKQSGIAYRAFLRPKALISEAAATEPIGILFGYGFRSPRAFCPNLPNMGDHNFLAVFIDVGIIGFTAYIGCLFSLYQKLARAVKQSYGDAFLRLYSKSAVLFFWSVILAMFAQEVLWPAHSRGHTFPVFILFMSLPYFYYESQEEIGYSGPGSTYRNAPY
jgi:hypothetical protein